MNEDKDKGKENEKKHTPIGGEKLSNNLNNIITAAVIVMVIVFLVYILMFAGKLSDNQTIWGQFGDYFGGVLNPILSFFALIALLFTIKLQSEQLKKSSEELELSTKELKLTREQLERSADFQKEQSETLKKQLEAQNKTFEQTERFRAIEIIYNDDQEDRTLDVSKDKPGEDHKEGSRLKAEAVKTYVQVERIRIAREQKEAEENGTTPPKPYINLSNADLEYVILDRFDLSFVNFIKTILTNANLGEATLTNVSLVEANLKDIKNWRKIKSIKGANITDVKNAPEGFIEWALENGAVIDEEDSETPDEDTEDSNDPFQTPKK